MHAKALLAVGSRTTRLAIGSFNLTRKGLGLRNSNAEAGLLWSLPNDEASGLGDVVSFGTAWRKVTRKPEEFVVEPPGHDNGDDEGSWPAFILSLRAKRDELLVEGDSGTWPGKVVIRMRDIRSRLLNQEQWFDPWTVRAPADTDGVFSMSTPLSASWLEQSPARNRQPWPALPDLEAKVSWDESVTILPVVFEDKHLFPVVESRSREDEQSLVAWFLGLRPAGEMEDGGFGHSINPIHGNGEPQPATGDILSYVVRDFVHALPGIRNRLTDAGMTETGLRTALLGPRSPVELARESLRAYRTPQPGKPRKTAVATAFQLAELRHLLQTMPLPELAAGAGDTLRNEAVAKVSSALDEVISELPAADRTEVVRRLPRSASRATMIVRPDGLDLRRSLRAALGNGDRGAVEKAATRQERTIDAILRRLYDDDDERRREIVLLADEVGLGKTFVALGVAWSVLHQRSAAGLSPGPVLVVTPHAHALFRKWSREAEQFRQLVAPPDMGFDVETAWTPHDLAHALRKQGPTLVIARMSAFSGQLHGRDIARMAAIHSLLHMDDFNLSMDLRLEMLSDWPSHATRTNLDLRRSSVMWEDALNTDKVCFDDRHIRAAWHRLERIDPWLCNRIRDSWKRVRSGRWKRSSFWEDLREICRAALGQTVPHKLPLVIVDEIHNWKNHPAELVEVFPHAGATDGPVARLVRDPVPTRAARTHPGARTLALHRPIDGTCEFPERFRPRSRCGSADGRSGGRIAPGCLGRSRRA